MASLVACVTFASADLTTLLSDPDSCKVQGMTEEILTGIEVKSITKNEEHGSYILGTDSKLLSVDNNTVETLVDMVSTAYQAAIR